MSIVITPWSGKPELIKGWDQATIGFDDRIVVMDMQNYVELPEDVHVVRRPDTPTGYGEIVNLGFQFAYGSADPDTPICLCNNDINGSRIHVGSVPERMLLGPRLMHTGTVGYMGMGASFFERDGLVDVAYLDGWALIARADTWQMLDGPYPELPGFYWEDTLMQTRLQRLGILLGVVPLPWRHLGGQTTQDRPSVEDEFWANRETFKSEVFGD